MAKQVGLGRGLGALIKDTPAASGGEGSGVIEIPISEVTPNRHQPRQSFDPAALAELVSSVREQGIMQPLLVRPAASGYELIAGERRFRAAGEAGLEKVPVIIREVTDQEALELALVENLQREDLNVIEEAEGYQQLSDLFKLTQAQIAARVGKARTTVANLLRLLDLEPAIRDLLAEGGLSAGHAKVLLGVEISAERERLAKQVVREQLSVRALEQKVARANRKPRRKRTKRTDIPPDHLRHVADVMHRQFGTSVRVESCRTLPNGKKSKGTIEIDYFSADELDRLLTMLGVAEDL